MVSGGAETEGGYGKSSLGIGGLGFRRLVPLGALVNSCISLIQELAKNLYRVL